MGPGFLLRLERDARPIRQLHDRAERSDGCTNIGQRGCSQRIDNERTGRLQFRGMAGHHRIDEPQQRHTVCNAALTATLSNCGREIVVIPRRSTALTEQ